MRMSEGMSVGERVGMRVRRAISHVVGKAKGVGETVWSGEAILVRATRDIEATHAYADTAATRNDDGMGLRASCRGSRWGSSGHRGGGRGRRGRGAADVRRDGASASVSAGGCGGAGRAHRGWTGAGTGAMGLDMWVGMDAGGWGVCVAVGEMGWVGMGRRLGMRDGLWIEGGHGEGTGKVGRVLVERDVGGESKGLGGRGHVKDGVCVRVVVRTRTRGVGLGVGMRMRMGMLRMGMGMLGMGMGMGMQMGLRLRLRIDEVSRLDGALKGVVRLLELWMLDSRGKLGEGVGDEGEHECGGVVVVSRGRKRGGAVGRGKKALLSDDADGRTRNRHGTQARICQTRLSAGQRRELDSTYQPSLTPSPGSQARLLFVERGHRLSTPHSRPSNPPPRTRPGTPSSFEARFHRPADPCLPFQTTWLPSVSMFGRSVSRPALRRP